jgi:hypothetical protein
MGTSEASWRKQGFSSVMCNGPVIDRSVSPTAGLSAKPEVGQTGLGNVFRTRILTYLSIGSSRTTVAHEPNPGGQSGWSLCVLEFP